MRCSHKFTYSPLAIHRHTDHLEHLDEVLFAALEFTNSQGLWDTYAELALNARVAAPVCLIHSTVRRYGKNSPIRSAHGIPREDLCARGV